VASAGSNYNALISSDHSDPLSGSVPMRSFACEIARIHAAAAPGWRTLRIAALTPEAPQVVSVTLAAGGGETLPDYRPGQYLPLRLDVGGRGVSRSYSLSGAAAVPGRTTYRITVKQVPGGAASTAITGRLRVGDTVLAQPPAGRFVIPLTADFPIVLLAAGIGITPFIAALETLAGAPDHPRIVLHYGNRNAASHVFRARLRELAALLPRLTVIDHYSQPRPGDVFDRPGRITADSIDAALIAARARFYLCGPAAMLRDLPAGLIARGVPRFEIFQEAFTSPPPASMADGAAHQVRFDRSGRVLTWRPADGNLLDFAEAHGLAPPSGCRVGQCESCAVPVLSGSFRYLSPIEGDEPDTCLTCQAAPTADLVLDA
jgi:ferredoxin-NADP reductase